jgi:hypothetical protein
MCPRFTSLPRAAGPSDSLAFSLVCDQRDEAHHGHPFRHGKTCEQLLASHKPLIRHYALVNIMPVRPCQ